MVHWLAIVLFVLARVTCLVLVLPGIGPLRIPWRIRGMMVTLLMLPVLCASPAPEGNIDPTRFMSSLIHECVVGISLGLVPSAILFGLQMAGQAIHGLTGLGLSADGDGFSDATGPMQRLFVMTAATTFFVSSGYRQVCQAILESFRWLPPGEYSEIVSTREMFVDLLEASFALGVRSLLPIIASLMVSGIVLMAINRVLPQLGYFVVGMSTQTGIMIASVVLFAGVIVWNLDQGVSSSAGSFRQAWTSLVGVQQP